jgi:two-component system, NtrC family, sensor kinase
VTNETTRVGRIVSDLLAFSRRGKPQRAPADVNKIVRMTLSLVQHKMKLSNVEVETGCGGFAAGALRPVAGAAGGAEPGAQRGRGHAEQERAGRVVVPRSAPTACAMLVVADNGEGIAPENLAKIFDPFFTTKPEGKGVGLGLAVSYGIIEAHGGDIEVKSRWGKAPRSRCRCRCSRAGRCRGAGGRWPEGMKYLYVGAVAGSDREDAAW